MPEARLTDPETSHAAADSIDVPTLRKSQAAVLFVLAFHGPMTDTELIDSYLSWTELIPEVPRQSPSGIRTRRKELVRLGSVADTGTRHLLVSGRSSIVWGASA